MEDKLSDENIYKEYSKWVELPENKFKSLVEFIYEELEKQGRIETVSTWDILTEEEKRKAYEPVLYANMYDPRIN